MKKVADRQTDTCPACGSISELQIADRVAVKFIGEGWPGEDIRKNSPKYKPSDYEF
jgi:predicted nucleic acid-binding Zn ribbon protein